MSELVVETAQGKIRGDVRHGARVWRGIPFAEPPVGELRFLPPRPPRPWTGERDGTVYGPVAMQARDPRTSMMSGITEKMQMGEDCLVANVFAPATGGKHPVLVWIHGGAFIMGAGSLPLYNGAGFAARHDLVVVTINYRLGLFGLLYLGELAGEAYRSGNVALLDQVAALRWVRDNIAAFGGDPDRVTVMGESAGAVSVANLLAMPDAQGLFHQAILQSGASGLIPPSRADATEIARAVLAELGVGASPGSAGARSNAGRCAEMIEGLAQVPAERFVIAQESASRQRGLAAFSPYVDGVTIPRAPLETVRAGAGVQVPLLLGSNRDEWSLFDVFLGEASSQIVVAQLRGRFGAFADRAHATYLAARSDGSAHRAWLDVIGDLAFRIPMIRLAEAQTAFAPVHMYRFDWASPAFEGKLGAAHALELPFVWNRLDNPLSAVLLGGDIASAQQLALLMHDTWAAFIRTGDPNGAGLPSWPRYDAQRRATLIIDHESRVVDDPDGSTRAIWPVL